MNGFSITVALVGAVALALGLASRPLSRSPFMPTMVALAAGVVLGPELAGWVDPRRWPPHLSTLLLDAARLSLALELLAIALRLAPEFPARHWRGLALLLGLGMPLMWGISGGLVYLVLGGPIALAFAAGAAVTPTDPVVAGSILTGDLARRHLPQRLRDTLSFESGVNDGLAYPFALLPLSFILRPHGEPVVHWALHAVLLGVGGGVLLGAAIGAGAGKLLAMAEPRGFLHSKARLGYGLALSLFVLGTGKLAGTDEVLAVFVAGMAFARFVEDRYREELAQVQDAVSRVVTLPVFLLIGTTLPWRAWAGIGWGPSLALCAAVLLLRRPPVLLALRPLLPTLVPRAELAFAGWFGPIGISALYYASLLRERLDDDRIWPIVSLLICASVLAHGLTAAPLTRRYVKAPLGRNGRGAEARTAPRDR